MNKTQDFQCQDIKSTKKLDKKQKVGL